MENNVNHLQPNVLSEDAKISLKTRVISAVIAILIAFPLALLGDWFIFGLILFLLIMGIWEIIKCAKRKYSIALYIFSFLLSAIMMCWPIIKGALFSPSDWRIFDFFYRIDLSPTIVFIGVFMLFFTVVIDKNFTVRDACFILTMLIIITLGLQSALYLRFMPNYLYHLDGANSDVSYFNFFDNFQSSALIFYVVLSAVFADTGAYLFGIFFGRNKINERISPKKTWEGFVGGLITAFIFGCLFGFLIPICSGGKACLLEGILDLDHWYNILILSAILPVFSTLGDFVFSSVKRFYEIKDFGKIMPGHGGVLDRLDSVLFACMAAGCYIYLFYGFSTGTIF